MAEKDSTTKSPEHYEHLSDLLLRPFWSLDGFIRTLDGDHNAHEDLLAVLIPLVEHIKSDLAVIDEVLSQSFGGHIGVELTAPLENWKEFVRDDFGKAFVAPAPA